MCFKYSSPGLPWWLRGENPPANAGNMGLISDPGRCHMPRSNCY